MHFTAATRRDLNSGKRKKIPCDMPSSHNIKKVIVPIVGCGRRTLFLLRHYLSQSRRMV